MILDSFEFLRLLCVLCVCVLCVVHETHGPIDSTRTRHSQFQQYHCLNNCGEGWKLSTKYRRRVYMEARGGRYIDLSKFAHKRDSRKNCTRSTQLPPEQCWCVPIPCIDASCLTSQSDTSYGVFFYKKFCTPVPTRLLVNCTGKSAY